MAEEFAKSVEDGLKLSKRIYLGKDAAVTAPRPPPLMEKSSASLLPASPMVYAVISNPAIVDNPDIPSYQPHVHGRCDPPALIPLQMNGIELEVDCYLDTAFVRVSGSWRVHCVMGSRGCPCRISVPMGEQGSILGVEVKIPQKSYSTQLIAWDDKKGMEESRAEDGGFLNQNIFTLTIPQVDGGSNLSIRLSWSQKLSYSNGQFSLNVPFSFPEYVMPAVKKLAKREKIQLNVNSGTGTEISCKMSSHPLKEVRRHVGKFGFSYEADVLKWSNTDFTFSYDVLTSHIFGGVLLQSPSVQDVDQREMFCMYLFPGNQRTKKVFKKDVIYIIDISGSMNEKPLEYTKNALFAALSQLDSQDRFNIIAFNGETYLFSSSMESASNKTVENAIQWVNMNFIAGGTTNIMIPLQQAIEMLSSVRGSLPIIFLVTDGTVEDERQICEFAKSQLISKGSINPRIHTFGIGTYCNHYFLQMLAMNSGGLHDAAYDVESVEFRMQKFFAGTSSAIVSDIAIDLLDDLDGIEVYPPHIPDLLYDSPLILSGRYGGKFPDSIKANGVLADLSAFALDLKIEKAKEIPLDRIFAKQHIDFLTAKAWLSEDKKLEEKVAKMSTQTGVASEYTRMMLLETDRTKAAELSGVKKVSHKKDSVEENKGQSAILLRSLSIGFGNLAATVENVPPGFEEPRLPEAAEIFVKATSNCCNSICNRCCCLCGIQCCSKMNDQCAIALTQLCAALACFGCFECCSAICCCGNDGD